MKRKLAAIGLAFSLAQLTAAYLPSSAVWLAAAFSLAVAVAACFSRRGSARRILQPLSAAVCLGLGCFQIYQMLAVRPVLKLAGRTVQVMATVQLNATVSYQQERMRGTLHITMLDGEPADLYVSCANFPGTRPGEIFSATFQLTELEENSYRMNYYSDRVYLSAEYLEGYHYLSDSQELEFRLYRLRRELSRRLMTWLPEAEGGVETAMLLGDTTRLGETQEEAFRAAGVSHLLAVSGLHVTLLCGLMGSAHDYRRRFSRPRILLRAGILLIYLALIGFPVSAVRAAFVYLIALGGYFFLQPPDTLTSMGLAAIVLGLTNAYFPCDLGFQLSFSAVLGVQAAGTLARWEKRKWREPDKWMQQCLHTAGLWLLESLQVTVLASIATMPVLIAHNMTVSGVGILTNLLVVWMLQPALVLGLLVLGLSLVPFFGFAMRGASLLLAVWLRLLCRTVEWCAELPGARLALPKVYTLFVLAVLGLLALLFWRAKRFGWYLPAAAVCTVLAVLMGYGMGHDVVRVAAVGTAGNACLVIEQNGRAAVLFRGGASNLRAVEDYLLNSGEPEQTLLVDLRQDPREMSFEANAIISMDTLSPGRHTVELLDGLTLDLLHDSGGNLAVLVVNGYTVGIMSGRVNLAQPVQLDVYCAGGSYPDSIDAETVLYTSQAADWRPKAAKDARLLYGAEEPVLTIRPGCSATFDGVKEYAVQ